jgi:hypothetical protein
MSSMTMESEPHGPEYVFLTLPEALGLEVNVRRGLATANKVPQRSLCLGCGPLQQVMKTRANAVFLIMSGDRDTESSSTASCA